MSMLKAQASDYSLTFAVDHFLRNFRPPEREKDAQSAAQEYLDHRERDAVRGFISDLQFKAIRSEMNWFKIVFGEQSLSAIGIEALRDYLERPKQQPRARRAPPKVISLKTWNNRRGLLNTFCLFCVEKGYLAENPIAKIPKHKINKSRATAETLTADQVKALMKFLETYTGPAERKNTAPQPKGFLVPFFALALFAGVRPDWKHGEISKLTPADIDFSTGTIRIEPRTSKVNERRTIKIQPNLRAWLEKYPIERYPQIPPKNVDRILREVRQKFALGHDVLRHTYISMTVGAFRSIGDAALQAGNSEAVIRKHYLDLKSTEEAEQFWKIVPKGTRLPKLEKREGWYEPVKAKKRS